MGGGTPLSKAAQEQLIDGLRNYPTAIVLLAENSGVYCGLLVAFENFSTFTVRPMINIHDIFVRPAHRGLGVGRRLINAVVDEAKKRNCSRISLEVRHDNTKAQNLYKSVGFDDTNPPLYYWRKYMD
jgi:ribosomal protein S18 acetylase RimI-like enzyme